MELSDKVTRYLRLLHAVEHEAMIADDSPMWLVAMLGSVDPSELADLIDDRCPTCGQREPHSVRVAPAVFACNPDESGGVRG